MNQLLFIVSREQPDLWDYWKQWFAGIPTVEVIIDRRQGERRQRVEMSGAGQRRSDRRTQPIDAELRSTGFEIIRSAT